MCNIRKELQFSMINFLSLSLSISRKEVHYVNGYGYEQSGKYNRKYQ